MDPALGAPVHCGIIVYGVNHYQEHGQQDAHLCELARTHAYTHTQTHCRRSSLLTSSLANFSAL